VSDAAARHDRAAVEERRAFAAQHSWDARTDQLAAALGLTDPIHTDAVAGARSARGVRR
jgi:hypothetical protein